MTQQLMAAIAEAQSQLGGGQKAMPAFADASAPASRPGKPADAYDQGHGDDGAGLGG